MRVYLFSYKKKESRQALNLRDSSSLYSILF